MSKGGNNTQDVMFLSWVTQIILVLLRVLLPACTCLANQPEQDIVLPETKASPQAHLAQAGNTLSRTCSGCAGRYVTNAASSSAETGSWASWPSRSASCCSHLLRSPESFPSKSATVMQDELSRCCVQRPGTCAVCMASRLPCSQLHTDLH